jgi:hypothetical protein
MQDVLLHVPSHVGDCLLRSDTHHLRKRVSCNCLNENGREGAERNPYEKIRAVLRQDFVDQVL